MTSENQSHLWRILGVAAVVALVAVVAVIGLRPTQRATFRSAEAPSADVRSADETTSAATSTRAADRDPKPPSQSEPLNSERIEARFGSFGIELLNGPESVRVANLYSGEDGQRTCRTFAVTVFPQAVDHRLEAEHRQVLSGGSIGATLKAAGWTVDKRQLGVGELPSSDGFASVYALMRVPPGQVAFKAYELFAAQAGVSVHYATITELYHPDYLTLTDLGVDEASAVAASELESLLQRVEAAARGLAM